MHDFVWVTCCFLPRNKYTFFLFLKFTCWVGAQFGVKKYPGAYTVLAMSAQMRVKPAVLVLHNFAKSVDSGKFGCCERTGAWGMFSPA